MYNFRVPRFEIVPKGNDVIYDITFFPYIVELSTKNSEFHPWGYTKTFFPIKSPNEEKSFHAERVSFGDHFDSRGTILATQLWNIWTDLLARKNMYLTFIMIKSKWDIYFSLSFSPGPQVQERKKKLLVPSLPRIRTTPIQRVSHLYRVAKTIIKCYFIEKTLARPQIEFNISQFSVVFWCFFEIFFWWFRKVKVVKKTANFEGCDDVCQATRFLRWFIWRERGRRRLKCRQSWCWALTEGGERET